MTSSSCSTSAHGASCVTADPSVTGTTTVNSTMNVVSMSAFGEPDVLGQQVVDTPRPRPGHVLIKVLATGVNRLDHYIRLGDITRDLALPHVLGVDAAGEVAALGEGVSDFQLGDRVLPSLGYASDADESSVRPVASAASFTLQGLHGPGTYAQYFEFPAAFLLKDDTGLSPAEAATLPVVLGSSVRALKIVGEVKPGDKVLIHSGASGSGSMQIQVAKALGAQVATTVRRSEKADFARGLGADLVINTTQEDTLEAILAWTDGRGVDVTVDNLGGDVLATSVAATRPFGIVVVYGLVAGAEARLDVPEIMFGQKQLRGSLVADPEDLRWGLRQVREGRVHALVDRELPLHRAAEAHQLIAAGTVQGNIVLLPWSD